MPTLEACSVVSVFAGMSALLAWLGRSGRTPWSVALALLSGPDQRRGPDLRFAAFLGSVVTLVAIVAAFPALFRPLSPGALAFALALALPLVAALQALAADLLLRSRPADWGAAPSQEERQDRLRDMLSRARQELETARRHVDDPSRVAALDALSEAVGEYDQVLEDDKGETARHLRKTLDERLRGVVTLARSCMSQERREASRALGVLPGASAGEATRLHAALSQIYSGSDALPGADPRKTEELDAALARFLATLERAKA